MSKIISEEKAIEIIHEFLDEILTIDSDGIMALYAIGSLGGGYYRPGQSDIDTVIIVRDDATITQMEIDDIAEQYYRKYNVPKGFGSVMIYQKELHPPYTKSEKEEFEFTLEIARLKTQGKAIYGSVNLNSIKMPNKEDFIKDAIIMEKWFSEEFGYPMFDQLSITGCINTILGQLRRYLIIEKRVVEFNKFLTIDLYMKNNPPIVNNDVFNFINNKLKNDIHGTDQDLTMLREFGIQLRDILNKQLLNIDYQSL